MKLKYHRLGSYIFIGLGKDIEGNKIMNIEWERLG